MNYRMLLLLLLLLAPAGSLLAQTPVHLESWYDSQITRDADGIYYIDSQTDDDALACQGYAMAKDMGGIIIVIYFKAIGKSAQAWGIFSSGENDFYYKNDATVQRWELDDHAAWVCTKMQQESPAVHTLLQNFCDGLNDGLYYHWQKYWNTSWFQQIVPNGFLPEHVVMAQLRFAFTSGLEGGSTGVATGDSGLDTFFPNDSSNEWVMYDDEGTSWLVIDPHYNLGWGMKGGDEVRGIFSCAVDGDALHWRGHNALGLPLMGAGVKIAHDPSEDSMGWTFTTAPIDTVDCYVLDWENQGGTDRYQMEDGWKDIVKETMQITFPNGQSVPYVRWSTPDHGPIVHKEGDGTGPDDKVYAGRANIHVFKDCMRMTEQWYEMLTAQDMDALLAVIGNRMAPFGGNMAIATSGSAEKDRIAYTLKAATPNRMSVPGWDLIDWDEVVDGSLYANIWDQVHLFSELPLARGDKQPFFINCNTSCNLTYARFKSQGFPDYITGGWDILSFRQQRAADLLDVPLSDVDYDLMYDSVTDTSHGHARIIMPLLLDAYVKYDQYIVDPRNIVDKLIPVLRNWDKKADTDSAVMYFFKLWSRKFQKMDPSYSNKFFSFASGEPPATQYPTEFTQEEGIDALNAMLDAYVSWFLPKYRITGDPTWGGSHYIKRIIDLASGATIRWAVSGDNCCLRAAYGHFYDPDDIEDPPADPLDYLSFDIGGGQTCPTIVKMTHTPQIWFTTPVDNAVDPGSPTFDPACPCTADWANEDYRDF